MDNTSFYLVVFLTCVILAFSTAAIYRLYIHPLSTYPGPRLWAISGFPHIYYQLRGILQYRNLELHRHYGPVVRISPNELSYATETAWQDIAGKPAGKRAQLKKDPSIYSDPPNGVYGMPFQPDDNEHARIRGNFSREFSQTAINRQESIIMKHVNLLISKLRMNCGKSINMVDWYSFVILDVIGDLAFNDQFNCLETSKMHFWPEMICSAIKLNGVLGMAKAYSPLDKVLRYLVPDSLKKAELRQRELTKEKVSKRLELSEPRSDFLSSAQEKYNTTDGMSFDEIVESSGFIILAGTDTTVNALLGTTYFLLLNPPILQKVASEMRQAFESEFEITVTSVNSLTYLMAVINESFRLLPPSATSMPRITPPEGCIIEGRFVPGNCLVGVTQWAANHLPSNFKRVEEFIPERWLGAEEFMDDKRGACQPFSVGPRNCLAQTLALTELKVILAKVIWNFDMEFCKESKVQARNSRVYLAYEKVPLMVVLKPVIR